MNTESRTLVFTLSLGLSMMCIATTGIIWQWGLSPAFASGTISEIFLYAGMLVVVGMATAFSIAGTIYYGVRALVQHTSPGLIEGISR